MRKSLFLIFSLVTTLAYGMGQRECVDAHRKALFDWDQHETLIQESQKVPGTEKELRLIQESLNCCQQALSTCKSIEDAIANKSKHKRKRHWCTHLSKKCARDNEKFLAEIEQLNTLIPELEASIAVAKKKRLQEKITQLQVEAQLLAEQGLKRGAYELRQQAISLQERDLNKEETSEEFVHLKEAVASFEKEIDDYRFRIVHPPLSEEKFSAREKERKTLFFEDLLLLNPSLFLPEIITNPLFPRALPLDGQKKLKEGGFFLYTDSFYRFLIQSEAPATTLFVKVFEQEECVHEEAIPLPCPGTSSWASYLQQGMLLAPETQLQSEFGLELRLRLVADPNHSFSLVIAQKSTHLCYRFSFSLDPEIPLYACRYAAHPPWQLDALCKPLSTPQRFRSSPPALINHIPSSESLEEVSYPLIDQFVEEFQRDPLALARFVQNEIALIDPFLHQEHGIFYPPGIQRNPEITFLERQGSAKEQSQLLVYLLRRAGYSAAYVKEAPCALRVKFVERMLLTQLPEDQEEVWLDYPWVALFDGEK